MHVHACEKTLLCKLNQTKNVAEQNKENGTFAWTHRRLTEMSVVGKMLSESKLDGGIVTLCVRVR